MTRVHHTPAQQQQQESMAAQQAKHQGSQLLAGLSVVRFHAALADSRMAKLCCGCWGSALQEASMRPV
jgi:hypothetical protein